MNAISKIDGYMMTWDQKFDAFVEKHPILTALMAAPALFALLAMAMILSN